MRLFRPLIAIVLLGSTLALGPPAARADLTVDSWNLPVVARLGLGSPAQIVDATVANPFSVTRNVSQGGSSNTTIYDFEWDAAGGSFNWDFDHRRAGLFRSHAESSGEPIRFTVTDVDFLYDFSGVYSLTGEQLIAAAVILTETTQGEVFRWEQQSRQTRDESFVVGQGGVPDGGDFRDILIGSPSGTLPPGNYELIYAFFIQAFPFGSDSGATAVGEFHMDLGDRVNPIPAPGTGLLGLMGLSLVGWFKRRLA